VFTPSGPSSDLVKCPYCEYDVEEWDEDDDPMYVSPSIFKYELGRLGLI
jgi:hypothetical protein